MTRLVLLVTAGALFAVTSVLLTIYPKEEWLFELSVSWPLTIIITVYATRMMGNQMLRAHLLTEQLRYRLQHDTLTDVYTRAHFFDLLSRDPVREGVTLLIDVDRFKQINDAYGHLVGDKVLTHVAGLLQDSAQDLGFVCRFGGDEFIVFLKNMDAESAQFWADSARQLIASRPLIHGTDQIAVTVSIGGSERHQAAFIDAAIHQADKSLYRVKQNARNGVSMAKDAHRAA